MPGSSDALAAPLSDVVAQARERWPEVALDPEVYARHVGERVGGGPDPVAALASLHALDLYLACACLQGAPAALAAFERELLAQVGDFVARVDGAAGLVDEIRQRLRERLFVGARPRIAEYSGRGALGGWVRVAAARTAIDLLREQGRTVHSDEALAIARAAGASAETELLRARYQGAYEAAIGAALAALDSKQRNLLRLHFVDGLSVDGIGRAYGVHRATAARWVARARSDLVGGTERILGEELRLGRDEIHSLAAHLRSQLHVSVARILR